MKNNKLLYLLTIIITIFSFNLNAEARILKAAPIPLTCVYNKGSSNDARKIILIQTNEGFWEMYENKSDVPLDGAGWKKSTLRVDIKDEVERNEDLLVKACPKYVNYPLFGGTDVLFFNDISLLDPGTYFPEELSPTESLSYVQRPNIDGGTGNEDNNIAKELTCVYNKGLGLERKKAILIQQKDGTKKLYTHSENASIDSFGWHLNDGPAISVVGNKMHDLSMDKHVNLQYIIDIESNLLNKDNNLNACPGKTHLGIYDLNVSSTGIITAEADFFDNTYHSNVDNVQFLAASNLETQYEYVFEPTKVKISSQSNAKNYASNYSKACRYKRMLESSEYHYIDMYFNNSELLVAEYDPEKTYGSYNYSGYEKLSMFTWTEWSKTHQDTYPPTHYSFSVNKEFTAEYVNKLNSGDCPSMLVVNRSTVDTVINELFAAGDAKSIYTTILPSTDYFWNEFVGSEKYYLDEEIKEINIEFQKINVQQCSDIFGEEITGYISIIWNLIKIGVPILLIVLGIIDFAQAIFSGKEDDMKKVQGRFIKRVIVAIVIFLIPFILELLLSIANSVWSDIGKDICGLIF